jgi:hypothetical protein
VPKERVRLDKETVTEDQTVSEEVRKERIEAEGDTADTRGAIRRRRTSQVGRGRVRAPASARVPRQPEPASPLTALDLSG